MGEDKHPVVAGFTALVAVALAVGIVLGAVAFGATRVLGVGGDTTAAEEKSAAAKVSLIAPPPKPTETPTDPAVTLAPTGPEAKPADQGKKDGKKKDGKKGDKDKKDKKQPKKTLELRVNDKTVSPGQRLDLTALMPGGFGKELQVQRKIGGGAWQDFPVSPAAVRGGEASTYVITSREGPMQFRVKVVGGDKTSNPVKVTVG